MDYDVVKGMDPDVMTGVDQYVLRWDKLQSLRDTMNNNVSVSDPLPTVAVTSVQTSEYPYRGFYDDQFEKLKYAASMLDFLCQHQTAPYKFNRDDMALNTFADGVIQAFPINTASRLAAVIDNGMITLSSNGVTVDMRNIESRTYIDKVMERFMKNPVSVLTANITHSDAYSYYQYLRDTLPYENETYSDDGKVKPIGSPVGSADAANKLIKMGNELTCIIPLAYAYVREFDTTGDGRYDTFIFDGTHSLKMEKGILDFVKYQLIDILNKIDKWEAMKGQLGFYEPRRRHGLPSNRQEWKKQLSDMKELIVEDYPQGSRARLFMDVLGTGFNPRWQFYLHCPLFTLPNKRDQNNRRNETDNIFEWLRSKGLMTKELIAKKVDMISSEKAIKTMYTVFPLRPQHQVTLLDHQTPASVLEGVACHYGMVAVQMLFFSIAYINLLSYMIKHEYSEGRLRISVFNMNRLYTLFNDTDKDPLVVKTETLDVIFDELFGIDIPFATSINYDLLPRYMAITDHVLKRIIFINGGLATNDSIAAAKKFARLEAIFLAYCVHFVPHNTLMKNSLDMPEFAKFSRGAADGLDVRGVDEIVNRNNTNLIMENRLLQQEILRYFNLFDPAKCLQVVSRHGFSLFDPSMKKDGWDDNFARQIADRIISCTAKQDMRHMLPAREVCLDPQWGLFVRTYLHLIANVFWANIARAEPPIADLGGGGGGEDVAPGNKRQAPEPAPAPAPGPGADVTPGNKRQALGPAPGSGADEDVAPGNKRQAPEPVLGSGVVTRSATKKFKGGETNARMYYGWYDDETFKSRVFRADDALFTANTTNLRSFIQDILDGKLPPVKGGFDSVLKLQPFMEKISLVPTTLRHAVTISNLVPGVIDASIRLDTYTDSFILSNPRYLPDIARQFKLYKDSIFDTGEVNKQALKNYCEQLGTYLAHGGRMNVGWCASDRANERMVRFMTRGPAKYSKGLRNVIDMLSNYYNAVEYSQSHRYVTIFKQFSFDDDSTRKVGEYYANQFADISKIFTDTTKKIMPWGLEKSVLQAYQSNLPHLVSDDKSVLIIPKIPHETNGGSIHGWNTLQYEIFLRIVFPEFVNLINHNNLSRQLDVMGRRSMEKWLRMFILPRAGYNIDIDIRLDNGLMYTQSAGKLCIAEYAPTVIDLLSILREGPNTFRPITEEFNKRLAECEDIRTWIIIHYELREKLTHDLSDEARSQTYTVRMQHGEELILSLNDAMYDMHFGHNYTTKHINESVKSTMTLHNSYLSRLSPPTMFVDPIKANLLYYPQTANEIDLRLTSPSVSVSNRMLLANLDPNHRSFGSFSWPVSEKYTLMKDKENRSASIIPPAPRKYASGDYMVESQSDSSSLVNSETIPILSTVDEERMNERTVASGLSTRDIIKLPKDGSHQISLQNQKILIDSRVVEMKIREVEKLKPGDETKKNQQVLLLRLQLFHLLSKRYVHFESNDRTFGKLEENNHTNTYSIQSTNMRMQLYSICMENLPHLTIKGHLDQIAVVAAIFRHPDKFVNTSNKTNSVDFFDIVECMRQAHSNVGKQDRVAYSTVRAYRAELQMYCPSHLSPQAYIDNTTNEGALDSSYLFIILARNANYSIRRFLLECMDKLSATVQAFSDFKRIEHSDAVLSRGILFSLYRNASEIYACRAQYEFTELVEEIEKRHRMQKEEGAEAMTIGDILFNEGNDHRLDSWYERFIRHKQVMGYSATHIHPSSRPTYSDYQVNNQGAITRTVDYLLGIQTRVVGEDGPLGEIDSVKLAHFILALIEKHMVAIKQSTPRSNSLIRHVIGTIELLEFIENKTSIPMFDYHKEDIGVEIVYHCVYDAWKLWMSSPEMYYPITADAAFVSKYTTELVPSTPTTIYPYEYEYKMFYNKDQWIGSYAKMFAGEETQAASIYLMEQRGVNVPIIVIPIKMYSLLAFDIDNLSHNMNMLGFVRLKHLLLKRNLFLSNARTVLDNIAPHAITGGDYMDKINEMEEGVRHIWVYAPLFDYLDGDFQFICDYPNSLVDDKAIPTGDAPMISVAEARKINTILSGVYLQNREIPKSVVRDQQLEDAFAKTNDISFFPSVHPLTIGILLECTGETDHRYIGIIARKFHYGVAKSRLFEIQKIVDTTPANQSDETIDTYFDNIISANLDKASVSTNWIFVVVYAKMTREPIFAFESRVPASKQYQSLNMILVTPTKTIFYTKK